MTLAELAVSIAVTGLLAGTIVSSILIASYAFPHRTGGTNAVIENAAQLHDLTADLTEAIHFTQRTPQAVEFTVPDRTGDGNPDVLRYAWSGLAGDPLTRQINGGVVAPLVPAVQAFSLAYLIDKVNVRQRQSTTSTSDLTLLASFSGWIGSLPIPNAFSVNSSNWAAEYFEPAIPEGALAMTITQVSLYIRKLASDPPGQLWVEIYAPGGGSARVEPTGSPLGSSALVSNATFGTRYAWVSFPFTNLQIPRPRGGYVLVVKATTATTAGRAYFLQSMTAPSDSTIMLWTTDGGASWHPQEGSMDRYDMYFRVHGTYSTRSVSEEGRSLYFLRGLTVTLESEAKTSQPVQTTARVLNAPEVSAP